MVLDNDFPLEGLCISRVAQEKFAGVLCDARYHVIWLLVKMLGRSIASGDHGVLCPLALRSVAVASAHDAALL